MDMACSTNGAKEECINVIAGKPKGKRPLGIPICRWVDNINIGLK
jgi:hypothetical protein